MAALEGDRPDPESLLKLAHRSGFLDENAMRAIVEAFHADSSRSIESLCTEVGGLDADQLRFLLVQLGHPQKYGNYELHHVLGRGAMGVVYRARPEELGPEVALKIPFQSVVETAEAREQHRAEAYLLRKIHHPNIVRFIDASDEPESLFLAMEFAEGPTVKQLLDSDGAFAEERAIEIARQCASAMVHYHSKGFVHRDLKPSNMILCAGDQVRILDLGVGRQAYLDGEGGQRSGTPHYMSPEQVLRTADRGSNDTLIQSDLYSLGATLFHMLTGRTLYKADSIQAVMQAHVRTPAPDGRELLPESSNYTWEIVERLLAKDRSERYQRPSEVLADLESWQSSEPPAHARDVRFAPVEVIDDSSASSIRPGLWIGFGAVAAAAIGIALLWSPGGEPPADEATTTADSESGAPGNNARSSPETESASPDPEREAARPPGRADDVVASDPNAGTADPSGRDVDTDETGEPSRSQSRDAGAKTDVAVAVDGKLDRDSGESGRASSTVEISPGDLRIAALDERFADVVARTWTNIESAQRTPGDPTPGDLSTAEATPALDESALSRDLDRARTAARSIRERLATLSPPPRINWRNHTYTLRRITEDAQVEIEDLTGARTVRAAVLTWSNLARACGLLDSRLSDEDRDRLVCLFLLTGEPVDEKYWQAMRRDERALRREWVPHLVRAARERRARELEEEIGRRLALEPKAFDTADLSKRIKELLGDLGDTAAARAVRAQLLEQWARFHLVESDLANESVAAPLVYRPDGRVEWSCDTASPHFADWDIGLGWRRTPEGLRGSERSRRGVLFSRPRFLAGDWQVEIGCAGISNSSQVFVFAGSLVLEIARGGRQARLFATDDDQEAFRSGVEPDARRKWRPLAESDLPPRPESSASQTLTLRRDGEVVEVSLRTHDESPTTTFQVTEPSRGASWRLGVQFESADDSLRRARVVAALDREWIESDRLDREWRARRRSAIQSSDPVRALYPGAKRAESDDEAVRLVYDFESRLAALDWTLTPAESWQRDSGRTAWRWRADGKGLHLTDLPTGNASLVDGESAIPVAALSAGIDEMTQFEYSMEIPGEHPCAVGHFVRGLHPGQPDSWQQTWLSREHPELTTQVTRGGQPLSEAAGRREFEMSTRPETIEVRHLEKINERSVEVNTKVGGRTILESVDRDTGCGNWVGLSASGVCVRVLEATIEGRWNPRWLQGQWDELLNSGHIDEIRSRGLTFEPVLPGSLDLWNQHGTRWMQTPGKDRLLHTEDPDPNASQELPSIITYEPWASLAWTWGSAWLEGRISAKSRDPQYAIVLGFRSPFLPFVKISFDDDRIVAAIAKIEGELRTTSEIASAEIPRNAKRDRSTWRVELDGTTCRVLIRGNVRLEFEMPEEWHDDPGSLGFLNPPGAPTLTIDELRIGPGAFATGE